MNATPVPSRRRPLASGAACRAAGRHVWLVLFALGFAGRADAQTLTVRQVLDQLASLQTPMAADVTDLDLDAPLALPGEAGATPSLDVLVSALAGASLHVTGADAGLALAAGAPGDRAWQVMDAITPMRLATEAVRSAPDDAAPKIVAGAWFRPVDLPEASRDALLALGRRTDGLPPARWAMQLNMTPAVVIVGADGRTVTQVVIHKTVLLSASQSLQKVAGDGGIAVYLAPQTDGDVRAVLASGRRPEPGGMTAQPEAAGRQEVDASLVCPPAWPGPPIAPRVADLRDLLAALTGLGPNPVTCDPRLLDRSIFIAAGASPAATLATVLRAAGGELREVRGRYHIGLRVTDDAAAVDAAYIEAAVAYANEVVLPGLSLRREMGEWAGSPQVEAAVRRGGPPFRLDADEARALCGLQEVQLSDEQRAALRLLGNEGLRAELVVTTVWMAGHIVRVQQEGGESRSADGDEDRYRVLDARSVGIRWAQGNGLLQPPG
jgi:hypothetical protein